jgi:hypothetical protein
MVRFLFVMLLAGCLREDTSRQPGDPGGPLPTGASCFIDSDCAAGSICARGAGCWPESELYTAHVTWTLNAMPPSATACAALPALTIEFDGGRSGVFTSFRPVACAEGKFTLESLPPTIDKVKLGDRELGWKTAMINTSTGDAALDLTF